MKALSALILIALSYTSVFGQSSSFNMVYRGSTTTQLCSGTLYDNGGPTGNYRNTSRDTFYIDIPGNSLSLTFTNFNTESCCDRVIIYDGIGFSGTQLVNKRGGSLPNSGNSITVPSGKATIFFSSDGSVVRSGFTMSWSGSGTSAPTASFSISANPAALNTPVRFLNISNNSGSSNWDFGDGSSSNQSSPIHSYRTPGTYTVELIETNCFGTDTTTQNITIQSAPQFSYTPDSLRQIVACGNNFNTSFTLNDTAGGDLFYDIEVSSSHAGNLDYQESFESGLGDFQIAPNASSGFTAAAVVGNAADGNAALQLSGFTPNFRGLIADLGQRFSPNRVSYYARPGNSTFNNGYTYIGFNNGLAFNPIFTGYYRNGTFYYRASISGSFIAYNGGSFANTWHQVELRNLDWVNQSYDIYIDNKLVANGLSFSNTNIRGIDEIQLNTTTAGVPHLYDNFVLGEQSVMPFTLSSDSGMVRNNGSQDININGTTSNLNAGNYQFDIAIRTNASNSDSIVNIPFNLVVTGVAGLNFNKTCLNYGSIFTGVNLRDSVLLTNPECDTLSNISVSRTSNDIVPDSLNFTLAPGDSLWLHVDLNTTRTGVLADTIFFTNSDTSFSLCVQANSTTAPTINTDSLRYTRSITGCPDTVFIPVKLFNTGLDTLIWGASGSINSSISDDFESSTPDSRLWNTYSSSISNSSSCSTISGSQSLTFSGGSPRYVESKPLDLRNGGTISFKMDQGSCDNAESGEGLEILLSTNNGVTWARVGNRNYVNQISTLTVSETIPAFAQRAGVLLRISQPNFSGSSFDAWIIDDFSLDANINSNIVFSPDTGFVSIADTQQVNLAIPTAGLTSGVYNYKVGFNSNDPANPQHVVDIELNLRGLPNIDAAPGGCLAFDTTVSGFVAQDSIAFINRGCGDLIISSHSGLGSSFSVIALPDTIVPGDTAFGFIQFQPGAGLGLVRDTLLVRSNDSLFPLCLEGYALGAPALAIDTSAIIDTLFKCNDSLLVQRILNNSNGLSPLNYKVQGSKINDLQSVLDTFKASSGQLTSQVPNLFFFSEGITGSQISDGGSDMYDGGNRITTDVSSGFGISYSNDLVVNSTGFGNTGAYFTYKASGMWLLAADLDNVQQFDINGNTGADGSGQVSTTVLNSSRGAKNFTGYVKRIFNSGDPSINHLIIVESDPNQSRTFSTNTDNDDHGISGLSQNDRLYYLLFASRNGGFVNDNTMQSIMDDFIKMAEGLTFPNWVEVRPDSGQVAASDSTTLSFWLKAKDMKPGLNQGVINLATNDPSRRSINLALQVTLMGEPDLQVLGPATCMDFDSTLQTVTQVDTLPLWNAGCDTLIFRSLTNNRSEFSLNDSLPIKVAPGDTFGLKVSFTPINVGLIRDTLHIANNDSLLSLCVSGIGKGAPVLNFTVDTLEVDVNKCKLLESANYELENTGLSPLNYDLRFGGFTGTSFKTYNTSGAITDHNFPGVPQSDTLDLRIIFNGDYDEFSERIFIRLDTVSFVGTVLDNNRNYQRDTFFFQITGTNIRNATADGHLNVRLVNDWRVDGGAGSFHQVDVMLRSKPSWVAAVGSASGTINAGSRVNKRLLFNATNLSLGTYQTLMTINSNDPQRAQEQVQLIMNVVSEPEIALSDTCALLPLTFVGDTSVRDFYIYNRGCQQLNISNISPTNPAVFSVSPQQGNIAVDDSLKVTVQFIPNVGSNFSATLNIANNAQAQSLCLNGPGAVRPVASFTRQVRDSCLGEVQFSDHSTDATSYFWDFGDGNSSTSQNPTHTYTQGGSFRVRLRVSNAFATDTISDSVRVNPFWAGFIPPGDTVNTNTPVSFKDSSLQAVQWSWNFGDGNFSTLQNPTHTYLAIGRYPVVLTATDARGCIDTYSSDIWVESGIGISELKEETRAIALYPNPNKGLFYLKAENFTWKGYRLEIYDMKGSLIYSRKNLTENARQWEIKLNDAVPGVYHVLLRKQGHLEEHRSFIIR